MKDNLKLIKNDGNINKARIEAISKVLETENHFEYATELIDLIADHLADQEFWDDTDLDICRTVIKHLREAEFWARSLIPDKQEQ